jgi:hypothetical protein
LLIPAQGRDDGSAIQISNSHTSFRHCERSEAIHGATRKNGLLRRGACHRARIRATRWLLAMMVRYNFAISRPEMPEACQKMPCPPIRGRRRPSKGGRREHRVRAAPAVSCAKVRNKNAHEHTGSAEAIRHSLRNGFNSLYRALPGDRAFLPPSPALSSANLTPASGRQDHTSSPSARKRPRLWRPLRPPHPAPRP